jgi:hypothetical protein
MSPCCPYCHSRTLPLLLPIEGLIHFRVALWSRAHLAICGVRLGRSGLPESRGPVAILMRDHSSLIVLTPGPALSYLTDLSLAPIV